jgi:hypothetical protein
MQLHLETNELNLLANLLMEQGGAPGIAEKDNALLEMVLARDLGFDSDQLEHLAGLAAAEKRRLQAEVSRQPSGLHKAHLQQTLGLLERIEEKVEEACVMF